MSIVSSTHTVYPAQVDGRRYVTEYHTDNIGVVTVVEYLAPIGTDYVAVRNARALVIAQQLADAEALALVG